MKYVQSRHHAFPLGAPTIVQRQIEGASYMTVLPKVVNSSVIEFDINSPECFLELNRTEVEVK